MKAVDEKIKAIVMIKNRAVLITIVSALAFSTLPLFGIYAFAEGANITTFLCVRFLIATALLWAYLILSRTSLPD